MALTPRSLFGPYQVIDCIGSGAMGDVYRARDPKLGRDVALKCVRAVSSLGADGRTWFEREARVLASLNHPHIATIYGWYEHDGASALALEFVEGETLAARLQKGRLPEAEALRHAVQIADALAYAHHRGVVHRDVKPTNIVLSPQGAKLLDFGLAQLVQPAAAGAAGQSLSAVASAGGTPFYMSPEQNAGVEPDQRSDLYSFGLVLCQMLTGFTPDAVSGISTRTLIQGLLDQIPNRPLRLVIERCLASDPDERWLHARDLHHALVAVSEPRIGGDSSTISVVVRGIDTQPRLWVRRAAIAAAVVAAGAIVAAFFIGKRAATVIPPAYQQLTFRRGAVLGARFAGNSIVYSAAWDGTPAELWSMRPESPESRRLGFVDSTVASVSSLGEMAVLMGRRRFAQSNNSGGMLARLPLDASAPRNVLPDVEDADWAPDGQTLAVAHVVQGKSRLEFPIGTTLHETAGWINAVRVSRDGQRVAFIDHPIYFDDRGSVSAIGRTGGKPTVLSSGWSSVTGVAWSPSGDEIWFTAARYGATTSLYAVDMSGRLRLVSQSANRMTIRDIDATGRVLLTEARYRLRISAAGAHSPVERDLSWLDGSVLTDLSPDGSTLLINEQAAGGGTPLYAVYLRKIDGSPAVRLGEGYSPSLSPDGQWVSTLVLASRPSIGLLPTSAGQARKLAPGSIADYDTVTWFPDGKRLLIAGNEAGQRTRLWTQELPDGSPKPVPGDGFRISEFTHPVSPDGTKATVIDAHGQIWVMPLTAGDLPQPVRATQPGDLPIRWDAEGRSFYVYHDGELPAAVYRVYPSDGKKERAGVVMPADLAGVRRLTSLQTTPDGRLFVYSYAQNLSDLFLVSNLR